MSKAISYNDVKMIDKKAIKIGDSTFDNFISKQGGIELGTMIALAGTPGAGKTTLCKKIQKDLSKNGDSIFFSLESRKSSVARQTKRVKTSEREKICDVDDFNSWSSFISYIHQEKPLMVIVDSLQHAANLLSNENGKHKYDNYKQIIKDLYDWKDINEGIVILIVQLNSKGSVEGPMATIFDVDCPIFLTANPKTEERTMHTEKNRMGPVGKIYYEFTSNDKCFKFSTEEEWSSKNNNSSESEKLIEEAFKFINSLKKKDIKLYKKMKSKISKIEYNNELEYIIEILTITKKASFYLN